MAHVLLPCDLPSWPDVQSQLSQLQNCPDGRQLTRVMADIFDACSVSLDPDDAQRPPQNDAHPGLVELGRFVEDVLTKEERTRFLRQTLPDVASRAADLKRLKPAAGFLYSLRKEGGAFHLERSFVASLLSNAFFSTFPKRNAKTHPTLQDFRMADFFMHLSKRSHQKKLKAFLRYFENLVDDPTGHLTFTRKVVSGPSLPGWLCSDRPLVPLVVRTEGSVQEAESQVYRACFSPPLIGGDVLRTSNSKEASLFFAFPELLIILSFVESLGDDEALIAELPGQQGVPVGFCFLDAANFSDNTTRQFEDRFLLRELNKALAAFQYDPLPVAQSREQTSHQAENLRPSDSLRKPSVTADETPPVSLCRRRSSGSTRRTLFAYKKNLLGLDKKSISQTSSKLSMRTASQSSVQAPRDDDYYTADEDSDDASCSRPSDSLHRTEDTSISRSDSLGFVLGDDSEDSSLPQHERLDDFRKRIRKRTRRRCSRRSSRSSYVGSSGSSDMEDISEDPELLQSPRLLQGMRPANSEPSIVSALYESICHPSPLSEAAEVALLSLRGRKMMVTASNGHLKAYSYDGVSPNLPVPFRAKFRRRRHHSEEGRSLDFCPSPSPPSSRQCSVEEGSPLRLSWRRRESSAPLEIPKRLPVAVSSSDCCGEEGDSQLKVTILWLAASMADLQALILYTVGQAQLHEVATVYGKVLSREWTVGDLSCEVLRFCRNRLYPRRKSHTRLFGQLIGQSTHKPDSLELD